VIDNHISEILGRRRENVSDLARGAGLSRTTCHALYHATSSGVTFDVMDRLCRYLDCQPGELFTWRADAQA
jgi:putative transcriptional regulator